MRHSLRECDDQSSMVSGMRGIFGVKLSQNVRASTTRSFDFLGLSFNSPPSRLLHKARLGKDVIVGVIDTGIIFPIRGSPDLFLGCSSYFTVPPIEMQSVPINCSRYNAPIEARVLIFAGGPRAHAINAPSSAPHSIRRSSSRHVTCILKTCVD